MCVCGVARLFILNWIYSSASCNLLPCYPLQEKLREGVLEEYDKHEDSVYSVAWSNVDPWLFASLSNDGRLVLNKVSKEIKFSIIL